MVCHWYLILDNFSYILDSFYHSLLYTLNSICFHWLVFKFPFSRLIWKLIWGIDLSSFVSHMANVFCCETHLVKIRARLIDSQPIIYSKKLLLFATRLQNSQIYLSFRIIHGFPQWQILALPDALFTTFCLKKAWALKHFRIWQFRWWET